MSSKRGYVLVWVLWLRSVDWALIRKDWEANNVQSWYRW